MSSSKNKIFQTTSFLSGMNSSYIDELYEKYAKDPQSIQESWRDFFSGLAENKELIQKTIQKQLFVELNTDEQKVYDFLLKGGKNLLDVIGLECKIPVYKLAPILLQLEMKGVLKPLPGKLFEVI